MKVDKSDVSIIVIILLCILLIFLPNIAEKIHNEKIKLLLGVIAIVIAFGLLAFDTYQNISKREYSTSIFMLLSDIVIIFVFFSLANLHYKNYNVTDIEILAESYGIQLKNKIYFAVAFFIKQFLKSERFKKKEV